MSKVLLPEDWHVSPLDKVAAVQTGIAKGKTVNGSGVTLPYLRVANVQDGHVDLSVVKEITVEQSEVPRYSLRDGDVLFTEGGDFDKLGRGTVWHSEISPCLHQNHVFAVRPAAAVLLPEFLAFQAASTYGRRYFQGSSKQSTNLASINSTQLKNFPVLVAPLKEQRKIVAVLRTWDEAIDNLTRLTELREKQYSGLRDYLIDWSKNQRPVKEFLKPVSRPIPKPTSGYHALSIRSHGKGTFDRFVEDPESVEMDTLYVAKAGDIIVNITFAWEGAVALVPRDHDGCLVSHRFPTFIPKPEKVDAPYLRHALRMARFTYLLGIASPGGAGRNRVLSKSDFLELMVPLPPLDRQQRIAKILDHAEKAVATEEKCLSALNRQKRGLMQKLLTGEWRVKGFGEKESD